MPHDEAGGSSYPREIHPRTCLRVRLNQAVDADDVELPELMIVRVLVCHLAIEQDEPIISVDHTRYALTSMNTIGNNRESLRRRMVALGERNPDWPGSSCRKLRVDGVLPRDGSTLIP